LPEDLEGEHNVVLLGFHWWQQTLIDTWVPSLQSLAARRPGLRFYELVAVPRLRLPARRITDGGMVDGIPDPEVRARTLTTYTDLGELLRCLGLADTGDITVSLTDRAGRVTLRAAGAHDDARQATLERALALG